MADLCMPVPTLLQPVPVTGSGVCGGSQSPCDNFYSASTEAEDYLKVSLLALERSKLSHADAWLAVFHATIHVLAPPHTDLI